MENSNISWTDHTFNPWIGCSKVSPGCTNCYAEAQARKLQAAHGAALHPGHDPFIDGVQHHAWPAAAGPRSP